MQSEQNFTFNISLSVLNHLGRNLYRSFMTVLGEAISNSWDADASDVWIYIDREGNRFAIKDNGDGMTSDDFQSKFLKIGYSKRKDGSTKSTLNRPYIGRKGIGKLALLSCADTISVISKTSSTEYVGGVIDNSGLDAAIKDDLTPDQYTLNVWDSDSFDNLVCDHDKGTIILFEGLKEGIKNRLDYIKMGIALYFRFSLIDSNFRLHVNEEQITLEQLNDLAEKTEFLWNINNLNDPFISTKLTKLKESKSLTMEGNFNGFIASVEKPSNLKIRETDERLSVDLFVNGRLRERDILKHIPTTRLTESYLYGQIHFNELDDDTERFATAREGIVANDPKFQSFLKDINRILGTIIKDWDEFRRKHRKDGDSEDTSISKKQRKAEELFNIVSEDFILPVESEAKSKVDGWVDSIAADASFNVTSYTECFISENLIRNFIDDQEISWDTTQFTIDGYKRKEAQNKASGNINIGIRRHDRDLSYLDMTDLTNLSGRSLGDSDREGLRADSKAYRPIRDAIAHTALLTDEAKTRLTTLYQNIKGRLIMVLSAKPNKVDSL